MKESRFTSYFPPRATTKKVGLNPENLKNASRIMHG